MTNRSPSARYPLLALGVPKAGSDMLRAITLEIPGAYWADHIEATRELATPAEQLAKLEERLTDLSPGATYSSHLPYSRRASRWLAERGVRVSCIFRDPRDYTVSWHHWVMNQPPEFLAYRQFAELDDDEERLTATIRGIGRGREEHQFDERSYPNVRLTYEAFTGWLDDPICLCLKYEDLIPGSDGKRPAAALPTIAALLEHAGIEGLDNESPLVREVLARGTRPASSYTFRRGVAGTWHESYTEAQRRAFDEVAGDLLHRLGYL